MSLTFPASLFFLSALYPLPVTQDAQPELAPKIAPEVMELELDRARRMTVPVSIGTTGPFSFVIDTGSERTVVSHELATDMALELDEKANLISVAGRSEVQTVYVPELTLGIRTYNDLIAPTLKARNIGADGILGLDSLQNQRILFDFVSNEITIEDVNKRPKYKSSNHEIVVVARRRSGQLIFTDAYISGVKVNVIIDTGGQVTIGNRALQRKLRRQKKMGDSETDIIAVTGQRINADIGWSKDFNIGKANFSTIPIAYADAPPFKKLGLSKRPALLLGMDILRKFDKMAIDFANRRVHFLLPKGAKRIHRPANSR